jgi:hypothetical protein
LRPQQLTLIQSSQAEAYVWKLVVDSEPEDGTQPEEYNDGIGLCDFDFSEAFKPPTGDDGYAYPYLKLLQKMWPGDWKQHLRQLNIKATAENAAHISRKNWRNIQPVSEQDWWIFIGILISAVPHGKGGIKLWEKHRDAKGMTHAINYGPDGLGIMPEYRFKEIKSCFPWSFQDKSKADEGGSYDPWNMVMRMVDGYNKNRHDWVAASVRKVHDETMSAFQPQTTPTGGLPHLSFILRKPEPLGTEFKVTACAVTGELLASSCRRSLY